MTRKTYRSAQGKVVDLGALQLQNESVRAVGNMNVNARGDIIDGGNRVIDQKTRQVQRQYQKQTNVSTSPVPTSNRSARESQIKQTEAVKDLEPAVESTVDLDNTEKLSGIPAGGLAAAIARSRAVKQELEKTPRQLAQQQPLKKI
jgi:hypothetical protein